MSEVTRRFRVTGKVQGVYFRHSTRLEAERLALSGYARNLPDGSVEVAVRGPASGLDLWLWNRQSITEAGLEVFGDRAVTEAFGAVRL